jgi:ribonuclease-3
VTAPRSEAVSALERALEYTFEDPSLAETALWHPSYAHEQDGSRGNERLEFLGDAVLDLVVARRLYEIHPDWTEGALTKARAALVKKDALAARAKALGLDEWVHLGRTELRAGRRKASILANCFEAVLGAVYLDGGLEQIEPVVERCFGEELVDRRVPHDAKTAFQEWAHAELRETPRYRMIEDTEVENDEARFTVEVSVGGEIYGRGVGRTKRAAEMAAAEAGLAEHGG